LLLNLLRINVRRERLNLRLKRRGEALLFPETVQYVIMLLLKSLVLYFKVLVVLIKSIKFGG
jgi:hypothetical protein